MSRSIRHSPVITMQQNAHNVKKEKRRASKAARKADIQSGGSYKKVYETWNICDYVFHAWNRSIGMWTKKDRNWIGK